MTKKTKEKKKEIDAISKTFGKTRKAEAKKKKTSKKSTRKTVDLPKPFEILVADGVLKNAMRNLKAKTKYAAIKKLIFDVYLQYFTKHGNVAPSMVGQHGDATALFTLRRMTTISEDTASILKKNKIPFDMEDMPMDGYVLNPRIMFDQDLLGKLAIALQEVKELKQFQDLLFIEQESLTTYTVNDQTYKKASKIKDLKKRKEVLEALTNLSMSQPALDGKNHTHASTQQKALKLLAQKGVFDDNVEDDDDIVL